MIFLYKCTIVDEMYIVIHLPEGGINIEAILS